MFIGQEVNSMLRQMRFYSYFTALRPGLIGRLSLAWELVNRNPGFIQITSSDDLNN